MKIKDQVTSLELSKQLKELQVRQESLFYWIDDIESPNKRNRSILHHGHIAGIETQYSAFTSAELGELLPENGKWKMPWKHKAKWYSDIDIYTGENTEAEARAKILIYLIENNLLKL